RCQSLLRCLSYDELLDIDRRRYAGRGEIEQAELFYTRAAKARGKAPINRGVCQVQIVAGLVIKRLGAVWCSIRNMILIDHDVRRYVAYKASRTITRVNEMADHAPMVE